MQCHPQKFIWFGRCLRQKMNQPHGHGELQTQFQLSIFIIKWMNWKGMKKGKNDRKIQPGSWLCWKNIRAAAWQGFIRKAAPGEQEQPGCSRELCIFVMPGWKLWRAQPCCLHGRYWRGRAQHSWKESKHSFQVYQGHNHSNRGALNA